MEFVLGGPEWGSFGMMGGMPRFAKESLERLRERIDLVDVLESHIDLKRAGAAYKALCPFHEEKTPSFTIQRGDRHYHCFGCGAHGDAIQFLMTYLSLSFAESVEMLAEKFNLPLEYVDKSEEKGPNKGVLKGALEKASQFFQSVLLYTEEGHRALAYLHKRGLTLDFIKRFEIGFAPQDGRLFRKMMHEQRISDQILQEAGLLTERKGAFFRERITFPIRNAAGSIIGFSARKISEETYGGKYINTSETPLFKKSRILFGLNYARRRIAKDRRALIVEGQIDCLMMIEAGLTHTVASLGTAFGESHVTELKNLGVRHVDFIFDSDRAGKAAVSKTGNLFQKVGIEVGVVTLPQGSDPDSFLRAHGAEKLLEEIEKGRDYLSFQVDFLSQELNPNSPAGKNELVNRIQHQIKEWEEPVMVHESLRRLAELTRVPEEMVGVRQTYAFARRGPLGMTQIDPNRILELDLLRWLIVAGDEEPQLFEIARNHVDPALFTVPVCRGLYESLLATEGEHDLLSLLIGVDEEEGQACIDEILAKKINKERALPLFVETAQKMLDREWMRKREAIKMEIHSGKHTDDEVLALAKEFDALKEQRRQVTP